MSNEDVAYPWLLSHITRLSSSTSRHLAVRTALTQTESGNTDTNFLFTPGHGTHYFPYRGRFIQCDRHREQQSIQRDGFRLPFETVTLTTIGTDATFLKHLLQEATRLALAQVETGIVVYHAIGHEWRRFGAPRRKRPLASIVLDNGISNIIHNDILDFIRSAKWYGDRGVPYRRGYLLHGPPGCGKSSFISGLASDLGYSVCMVSLSERTLDDDRLNHLLNTAPPNSIVLLEDVDAAFQSREDHPAMKATYEGLTRVTFSGLLNAIDGVACAEGRVLFMTTNYLNRLDPALIRPGRVDVQCYFGYCTPFMIEQMFRRFYEEHATAEEVSAFVSAVVALQQSVSPAQIQGLLLKYKTSPSEAVRNVGQLHSV